MSSEDEIDDFKDHPNYKLTEKLSTFSFNSDVKKKSDEQKKGERHHKLNSTSSTSNTAVHKNTVSERKLLSSGASRDDKAKSNSILNQSLGWRDPGYQYERNITSKKSFQNKRLDSNTFKEQSSFTWRKAPTGSIQSETVSNEDKSGWLALECFDDHKNADAECVWAAVNQIYDENPEWFVSRPLKSEKLIKCYTRDYKDISHIRMISNVIRQKLENYPFIFYYKTKSKCNPMYMSVCDGDMYKFSRMLGWKVIDI